MYQELFAQICDEETSQDMYSVKEMVRRIVVRLGAVLDAEKEQPKSTPVSAPAKDKS